MARKTERVHGSAPLDGNNRLTVVGSIAVALMDLENECNAQGRDALFDTLEISVERKTMSVGTMTQRDIISTTVAVLVSAEAVLR